MVSWISKALEWWQKPIGEDVMERMARHFEKSYQAAYDGTQTTPQMETYWSKADLRSPQAATTRQTRQVLRSRSRYECVESNSYARGMVLTKVNDVIGKGPTLQITLEDRAFGERLENEFAAWARAVNLPEKLRVMTSAKIADGEAFAERITNKMLSTPVKLDLRLSEADLWTNYLTDTIGDANEYDGIKFDKSGNPIRYRRLNFHPGDSHMQSAQLRHTDLKPEDVIHWYRMDRPDQKRGIPEFAAALPMFAEMRRWIMATIASAETAAEFAAVVESTAAAFSENPATIDKNVTIPINRRTMATLPRGWTMKQFRAEHPNSQFEAFEEKLLMQIARCMQMPLNIAMGSSRRHNFASGRLDYLLWWNHCDVERNHCEFVVLDRVFQWWLEEARMVNDYLPPFMASAIPHRWYFPARRPIDEVAHAKSTEILWNLGLITDEQLFAEASIDPDEHYEQLRRQMQKRQSMNLPVPGVKRSESLDPNGEENETEMQPEPAEAAA